MSTTAMEPKIAPSTPPDDPTSLLPKKLSHARPLFDPEIVGRAISASFGKLNPITLMKNPVMFVVEIGALLTTIFLVRDVITGAAGIGFSLQIALWLWFTVLFANFAEAGAEPLDPLVEILGEPQQMALLPIFAGHAELPAVDGDRHLRHGTSDWAHGLVNGRSSLSLSGWSRWRHRARRSR